MNNLPRRSVVLPTLALFATLYGCATTTSPTNAKPARSGDCIPEVIDTYTPDRRALSLVACFNEPDPALRDAYGYTQFAAVLRDGGLTDETVLALNDQVSLMLKQPDSDGFQQPFAALALAEIVRVDRIKPVFNNVQRSAIVKLATDYVINVRDYRGFSEAEGWRHGVAHGADLLLQLTLNPNIRDEAMPEIVNAAISQVPGYNKHAYVFGEPGRLARPVLYAAQRRVIANDAWRPLLMALARPNGAEWAEAYNTESDLARLHNTRAFLQSLYSQIAEVEAEAFQPFKNAVRDALRALP
ncbi:MAG: DUF2785 domain-containing protein [Pseudomonadota bacterium]